MKEETFNSFASALIKAVNAPASLYYDMSNTKYGFMAVSAPTQGIDYSEQVTEPNCVLSMKDIYNKYVVNGEIAGLSNNMRPHISDECDEEDANETEFEERLDYLRVANNIKSRAHDLPSISEENSSEDKPSEEQS